MQTNLTAAYPLSPMQQGMLFHTLYAPQSGVDIEQMVLTLSLPLDVIAFQYAWETVVARHPVFRTKFRWQTLAEPLQEVYQTVSLPLKQHDWSQLSETEQAQQFEEYLQFDRHLGFKLDEAPLARVTIFKLGAAKFRCLWTFHHILLDGRSFPVVLHEVFTLYQAACQGQAVELPSPQPYQTYITWLQHQDVDKAEPFWREQLRGFEAPTPLVVDQEASRSAKQADNYSRQGRQLSASLTSTLRTLAEQHELTVNTFVHKGINR